jgi:hypothetical protein
MGCNCGKNAQQEKEYVVKLPDGREKVVRGENAARIEVTVNGGGSYTVKSS